MCRIFSHIVGDNLKGKLPFTFPGGDEIKGAPLLYVPHLVDKVVHFLKGKSEIQMLLLLKAWLQCWQATWHEGFIPASEGGFQGYSRVHGLLPYPEVTVSHFLEDHAVQWANTYHAGFGLLEDQGAELIHAKFNRLGLVFAPICCA